MTPFLCFGCYVIYEKGKLGELSLLQDCQDEDCYISLVGWPPEKLALELEHMYWTNTKVTELHNIFKHRPTSLACHHVCSEI